MTEFTTKKGTKLPISNIKGKEYLEVKWRIVWFQEEHPDWSIETQFLEYGKDHSFCKAIVRNEKGALMATSHKFEDIKGFADHREKSETGSIGRALALLGYGTQFCTDLDEGQRLADSPVARADVPRNYRKVTPQELRSLNSQVKEWGIPVDTMKSILKEKFNVPKAQDLNAKQILDLRDELQNNLSKYGAIKQ